MAAFYRLFAGFVFAGCVYLILQNTNVTVAVVFMAFCIGAMNERLSYDVKKLKGDVS